MSPENKPKQNLNPKLTYKQLLNRSLLAKTWLGSILTFIGLDIYNLAETDRFDVLLKLIMVGIAGVSARFTIIYYFETIKKYNVLGGLNPKFYEWVATIAPGCKGDGVRYAVEDIIKFEAEKDSELDAKK